MQSTGYSSAAPQAPAVQPAPPDPGAAAYRKLLDGSESGQLNLRAVKDRGQALKRSLDELIAILQFEPQRLTWDDCLERFSVMGVRHQQLVEQIRPLLKFYVAHPKAVNQSNAELIPLLLSTMKLPEMEAEEGKLLQDQQKPDAEQLTALGATLSQYNSMIGELTHHSASDSSSGILDPKGSRRISMARELRNEVNKLEEPVKASRVEDPAAKALLEAALTGKGL